MNKNFLLQKFPGNLLPSTFYDPDHSQTIQGRTELERRGGYIDSMDSLIGPTHPPLAHLVKQCLQNIPGRRPSAEELLTRLQATRVEMEGEYGSSLVKMDVMMKMKLAKEMKMKDKRIRRLMEDLVGSSYS